jgi:hypothetical protein
MSQYRNANALASRRFEIVANRHYNEGVQTRDIGDDYVRVTVFLATVLFLTALGQRFEEPGPRLVIIAIASVLLLISMIGIFTLPRA